MPVMEIHERDLDLLLASLDEGICCLNARGELVRCNDMARLHWRIDPQRPDGLNVLLATIRALAREQVRHELVQVDEQRALLVNIVPLYGEANTVTGVVVISHDMSEHAMLEQHARRALEVLLEATLDTYEAEEIGDALRRIARLIPQLAGVDNSIALRVDPVSGRLTPLALYGSSQRSYEAWATELSEMKLGAEYALTSSTPAYLHAIRLARPLMLDFSLAPEYGNPHNLHAAIYAPVLLQGRVVGLLGAERHRPLEGTDTYFPQWSVDMLAALARLASMSIEKRALLTTVEHLRDETEMACQVSSQREEFLLLTAHELRGPLTAIRGHAQVLKRRVERLQQVSEHNVQELRRGLEHIERQTRRVEQITNTLLEASRVDLGRLELSLKDVDLVQMARRTLADYLPIAENHELRLFVEEAPVAIGTDATIAPSIIIRGDEQRLEQVLANLVSNAIKYSPQGGPVTVSLRCVDDGWVELAVEDRGIGIPVEDQPHLAERFYRGSNAQHGSARGLGLGLYLVHALATRHGGSLSVRSEGIPGKGSVFTVRLPVQGPEKE